MIKISFQVCYNRIHARHEQRTRIEYISAWKSAVVWYVRWVRWLARAALRRSASLAGSTFVKWLMVIRERCRLRHCMSIIHRKRKRSRFYEILTPWIAASKCWKLHRRTLQQCSLRNRSKRAINVIYRWRIEKYYKQAKYKQGKLAGRQLKRLLLSRTCRVWHDLSSQRLTIKRGSSKLAKRFQTLRVGFAFKDWHENVTHLLRIRHILGRSGHQSCLRLTRWGWDAFYLNKKLRRDRKTKIYLAERHRTHFLLSGNFMILSQHYKYSKRVRNNVQKIGGNLANRSSQSVLLAWHKKAKEKKLKKHRQAKVCVLANKRLLTECCLDWTENASSASRARLILGKSGARFGKNVLRTTFYEWCSNSKMLKRQKTIIANLSKNQQSRKIVASFDAWHQFAIRSKKINKTVSKLKLRSANGSVSHEFNEWKEEIRTRKQRGNAFQKASKIIMHGTMERIWNTWEASTDLTRKVKKLRNSIGAQLVRETVTSSFDSWKDTVSYNRRINSKTSQLMQHMKARGIKHAFSGWVALTSSSRRTKTSLMRCKPRIIRRSMSWALKEWQHYYYYEKRLLNAENGTAAILCKSICRSAWAYWRESVLLIRTMMIFSGRASARTSGQVMSWAHQRWKGHAAELRRQRQWMAKLAAKMRHLVEAAAFLVRREHY
jgi:hypothetical protein